MYKQRWNDVRSISLIGTEKEVSVREGTEVLET